MTNNLLKIESSSGRRYVFDAISNNIYEIELPEDFYSVSFQDLGYSSDARDNSLFAESISESVLSNAKTLIIEITEECNLRCKYCVFDETNPRERNHSINTLSVDIAKSEMVNFYSRTNGSEAYVIFYGGEPLLEFSAIKDLTEFGMSISNNKIKYSLTTNGILLSPDKINFFVENDFLITVSVDGPQDVHDSMRVSKNNKGTHKIIENNLIYIQKNFPDFFSKKIIINCTINNSSEICKIDDYFISSNVFKNKNIRFSPVLQKENEITSFVNQSILTDPLNEKLAIFKPVANSLVGDVVKKIEFRKLDEEAKSGKKICIPFSNRTYVRTSGKIQFCERVESYGIYVEKQHTIEQLAEILHDEYKSMKERDCSICFAYNFCDMCPASFIKEGKLDYSLSNTKCTQFRLIVQKALYFYIEKKEQEVFENVS